MTTIFIGKKNVSVYFNTRNIDLSPGLPRGHRRLEIKDFNSIFSSFHDCGPVIGECSKYLIHLALKLER